VLLHVRVVQFRHGQAFATAFEDISPIVADGSTQSWTATMFSSVGFKLGHAQVTARLIRDGFFGPLELAVAGATVLRTNGVSGAGSRARKGVPGARCPVPGARPDGVGSLLASG
jgi:hypothetical protein